MNIKAAITFLFVLCLAYFTVEAQTRFFTRNGKVYFNATAKSSPEIVDATNEKATSILDVSTGQLEFAVLMKAFIFEKALMEEHFNENYVESDKFPKASFKGSITNLNEINLLKDGIYHAKIIGKLTIHGITRDVQTTSGITVKGNSIYAKSDFKITLMDYGIEIPSIVKDKVANDATINIQINYEPLKTS